MMNDSTLSGTGLEVLQIVRSSIMLRSMVERHSDLLAVLMQGAEPIEILRTARGCSRQ
jgi:hypothetical protein